MAAPSPSVAWLAWTLSGDESHKRVRLDLLSPRIPGFTQIPGTTGHPVGVVTSVPPKEVAEPVVRSRAHTWRTWLVVAVAACTLLGQGERCRVDGRFRSPSATLETYWESLRIGDADQAWECFVEGRHDLPMPGMLWFLPPTEDLWLTGYRSLPVTSGRVMVTYEVHYRPEGTGDERMFKTGSELVRMRGEWRISQPLSEASMPEWKPVLGPVDT